MQNKANFPEGKLTQDHQLQWFMEILADGGGEKTEPISNGMRTSCSRRKRLPRPCGPRN